MSLRLLSAADLPDLLALSASAAWNQMESDWRLLLDLAPQSSFGIELDGRIVCSTIVLPLSGNVAWIGMVITLPEYRGRGLARQLFEKALEQPFVFGLDASPMGQPLYEQYGFRPVHGLERWIRQPAPSPYPDPQGAPPLIATGLLARLAAQESISLDPDNYACARPGRLAAFFGPCSAASPETAKRFLAWFLSRHARETCFWDLEPTHPAANLALEAGFQPIRTLVRMYRGDPIPPRDAAVYAYPGFEIGLV